MSDTPSSIGDKTTLVVTCGLRLDRAWPELGVIGGSRRREESSDALLEIVKLARDTSADALVCLGDLFDRKTVSGETLDRLHGALARAPGCVVLVPGSGDWLSDDSPYQTLDWPENVHVFLSSVPEPCPLVSRGVTLWGIAETSPNASRGLVHRPDASAPGLHVGLAQAGFDTRGEDFHHVVVADGDVDEDTSTTTTAGTATPIVEGERPRAVLLELDRDGALLRRESVALRGSVHDPTILDVSPLRSTEELEQALASLPEDVVVRLEGRLAHGLLLPGGLGDVDSRQLVVESLEFELRPPDEDDVTASAEFQRQILEMSGSDLEKHQVIALGQTALDRARADVKERRSTAEGSDAS